MKCIGHIVPLIALAGCASSPTPSHTAPAEEYYYDCDTPGGHFSDWNRTVAQSAIDIHGFVQVIEPRQDAHWVPAANIVLYAADKTKSVALSFIMPRFDAEQIQPTLKNYINSSTDDTIPSLAWKSGPIPFDVTLSKEGVFTITTDSESRSQSIGNFRPATFALSCSTGQFKFTKVSAVSGKPRPGIEHSFEWTADQQTTSCCHQRKNRRRRRSRRCLPPAGIPARGCGG
jgi:hypothetical protein